MSAAPAFYARLSQTVKYAPEAAPITPDFASAQVEMGKNGDKVNSLYNDLFSAKGCAPSAALLYGYDAAGMIPNESTTGDLTKSVRVA